MTTTFNRVEQTIFMVYNNNKNGCGYICLWYCCHKNQILAVSLHTKQSVSCYYCYLFLGIMLFKLTHTYKCLWVQSPKMHHTMYQIFCFRILSPPPFLIFWFFSYKMARNVIKEEEEKETFLLKTKFCPGKITKCNSLS